MRITQFFKAHRRPFIPMPAEFCDRIEQQWRFVVSFPRSGSRWVRLLLADLFNQSLGRDRRELYSDRINVELSRTRRHVACLSPGALVPNPYYDVGCESVLTQFGLPPIYKSHDISELVGRKSNKLVYVFRSPVPAFVSLFFYRQLKEGGLRTSIDVFCRRQLQKWCYHMRQAVDIHQECPDRILLVRYDGPFDEVQLASISSFFGLHFSTSQIGQACTNIRRFLGTLNRHQETKYRRGADGDATQHLTARTICRIERSSSDIYQAAVEIAAKQLAPARDWSNGRRLAG